MTIMMKDIPAYSDKTDTTYENWDALIEAETNGYCAVAIMQVDQPKRVLTYCRVYGPFPEKRLAMNKAMSLRKAFKSRSPEHEKVRLLTVAVEPGWKP